MRRVRVCALWSAVFCWGLFLGFPDRAGAHGRVGKRSFIEPFVTEDANPKDEFVLAKPFRVDRPGGSDFTLGFSFEKRLSTSTSIGLEAAWLDLGESDEEGAASDAGLAAHSGTGASGAAGGSGFSNLGLRFKYAPIRDAERETVLSFALEMEVPTGDEDVGSESHVVLEPALLLARGFGDLPEGFWFLRPLALMGDLTLEVPVSRREERDTLGYDVLFLYSLPYLREVGEVPVPVPLDRLLPVAEFHFETDLQGAGRGTEARTTLGLVYLDRFLELGVGVQLPLDETARDEFDWAFVGIVDLFYDDVLPGIGDWLPFE
ncbi:MAG: hypothetical protein KatS3mg076_1522 [Candidatus Binatia bacterium]|nr:MAG: hypothetical protein KatS3mg076_1522 [Candidatus Binatia bacterium]